MKSKSFDSGCSSSSSKINLGHNNNTFDFIRLYKTAEETKASLQKYKSNSSEGNAYNDDNGSSKQEKLANKRKKGKQTAVEMTQISIDGLSLDVGSVAGCSTPMNESHKATSTPITRKDKVKSIMKTTTPAVCDDAMDGSNTEVVTSKPKKRNKSVSFMLEDNEPLEIKKTKSKDDVKTIYPRFKTNRSKKKLKKDRQAEKENEVSDGIHNVECENNNKILKGKVKNKHLLSMKPEGETSTTDTTSFTTETVPEKKKRNKPKKASRKVDDTSQATPSTETIQIPTEKTKKAKKNKHEQKSQTDNDEEPAQKSRKTEVNEIKPEVIAEDLSNLSIGDNPTTLSSLLDEMTVTDKDKRKKLKKKISKSKKIKNKESTETQKSEEVKEKKWKHKRWNKDKKVKETTESLMGAIVVDNLPISLLFTYKKVLAEHFAKCGILRSVGIAEVYPSEVSKPVFTTTVYFDTEEAATKALEENGALVEGSALRVWRPLPAPQTTAVVRSYAALSEPALSAAFARAGRLRAIRLAVKGRNTMSTAFVEFDGPAAVERAIKMAEDLKIGGKKIHVSKFEIRPKKNREEKSATAASDADHSDNGDAQN